MVNFTTKLIAAISKVLPDRLRDSIKLDCSDKYCGRCSYCDYNRICSLNGSYPKEELIITAEPVQNLVDIEFHCCGKCSICQFVNECDTADPEHY